LLAKAQGKALLMIKKSDLWLVLAAVVTVALLLLMVSVLFPEAR
jgi:hypothetical protein